MTATWQKLVGSQRRILGLTNLFVALAVGPSLWCTVEGRSKGSGLIQWQQPKLSRSLGEPRTLIENSTTTSFPDTTAPEESTSIPDTFTTGPEEITTTTPEVAWWTTTPETTTTTTDEITTTTPEEQPELSNPKQTPTSTNLKTGPDSQSNADDSLSQGKGAIIGIFLGITAALLAIAVVVRRRMVRRRHLSGMVVRGSDVSAVGNIEADGDVLTQAIASAKGPSLNSEGTFVGAEGNELLEKDVEIV